MVGRMRGLPWAHLPRTSKAGGADRAGGDRLGHPRQETTKGPILQPGPSLSPTALTLLRGLSGPGSQERPMLGLALTLPWGIRELWLGTGTDTRNQYFLGGAHTWYVCVFFQIPR